MVVVFVFGIFFKKIILKVGEIVMIVGFLIGMFCLLINIFINIGKDVMIGWFWENIIWFW